MVTLLAGGLRWGNLFLATVDNAITEIYYM